MHACTRVHNEDVRDATLTCTDEDTRDATLTCKEDAQDMMQLSFAMPKPCLLQQWSSPSKLRDIHFQNIFWMLGLLGVVKYSRQLTCSQWVPMLVAAACAAMLVALR